MIHKHGNLVIVNTKFSEDSCTFKIGATGKIITKNNGNATFIDWAGCNPNLIHNRNHLHKGNNDNGDYAIPTDTGYWIKNTKQEYFDLAKVNWRARLTPGGG